MLKISDNRLFIPLTKQAFNWYKEGKQWEVRKYKIGQYNLKNVRIGRRTELRLGYQPGQSIWGDVVEVKVFESIEELLDSINYKLIIPSATTINEAKDFIINYVGSNHKVLAIKISIDI